MARILIVDDDPHLCDILELLLGERDHEVSSVRSLAQFNQVLSDEPPEVVLLDLNLPDVNGLELLPRINLPGPPPSLASSQASPTTASRTSSSRPVQIITSPNPFTPRTLQTPSIGFCLKTQSRPTSRPHRRGLSDPRSFSLRYLCDLCVESSSTTVQIP